MNRRYFCQLSSLSATALIFARTIPIFAASKLNLKKYVDPLPLPSSLHGTQIDVTASEFKQRLHRDLPPTTVWGYNGSYPGPTIEAVAGIPTTVTWHNGLYRNGQPIPFSEHLLPIDDTIMHAEADFVPIVAHLHGGHVPSNVDGGPFSFFLPGSSVTYTYPNNQLAATLWYHDHTMGITRLNVFAGLAGYYILRDGQEAALNLPRGAYEVPLVIQDRAFNEDGSWNYPHDGDTDEHPVWVPEFFGDTALVNGKVWPYFEVEPRRYRFRILNGSNARFYDLHMGLDFLQIGSDGGLLEAPVRRSRLLIAPGERADVIVDFSGKAGQTFVLHNSAKAPYPNGGDDSLFHIMKFDVIKPLSSPDTSVIPVTLRGIQRISPAAAVMTRDIVLREFTDAFDNPVEVLLNGLPFEAATTEFPKLGTTEIWRFVNTTGDTHPMHLHLVQFQVLDRQPFDVEHFEATGEIMFTGPAVLAQNNEMGWKDTVRTNPGEVTRIIARFEDYTGQYVYHCHILEHEDNSMMRPFEVVP